MVLSSCRCCCATLRLEKAAKVIGITFTVLGALSVISFGIDLGLMDSGSDELLNQLTEDFPERDAEQLMHHSRTMLVVRLCMSLVFTGFSVALVVGVLRGSRPLVLAFVVLFGLYMAVSTALVFYAFYDPSVLIDESTIVDLRKKDVAMAKVAIYITLAIVLGIYGFLWYLAAVVYSYYREMAKCGPTTEHRQLF